MNGAAIIPVKSALGRYDRANCDTRAKVRIDTIKRNRDSFMVNASSIIFVNRGQNYLLIDEQFVVRPGGWFREKNVCHDYSWRFITNASPPTADGDLVITGNHVVIRILNGPGSQDGNGDGGGDSGVCDTEFFEPVNFSVASVNITPATAITDDPAGELTLDVLITIPAGRTYVKIINKGDTTPVGGGFGTNTVADVTAGSLVSELPPDPDGIELRASGTNTATNEYGTLPETTIDNTGGAAIWWYAV